VRLATPVGDSGILAAPPAVRETMFAYIGESVERAWTAFSGIFHATNEAFALWQREAFTASEETREIAQKSMDYAEQNLTTTYRFTQTLMQANHMTMTELVRLQSEFLA
jgi:hypothetical protein